MEQLQYLCLWKGKFNNIRTWEQRVYRKSQRVKEYNIEAVMRQKRGTK